jgi:hypothetical protein
VTSFPILKNAHVPAPGAGRKKPDYCHPDGHFDRFAGVVVVESYTHLHANMKAEVSGAERGSTSRAPMSLMPRVRVRFRRT